MDLSGFIKSNDQKHRNERKSCGYDVLADLLRQKHVLANQFVDIKGENMFLIRNEEARLTNNVLIGASFEIRSHYDCATLFPVKKRHR